MSKVNVNTIEPSTGTDITLGASGDTITVPSGATFTQSGTMNASAITAGTLAVARGGTGTTSYSPGITEVDLWYVTSSFTETGMDVVTANWSRFPSSLGFNHMGTGMSQSSGIFTFPSTGLWNITWHFIAYHDTDANYVGGHIYTTEDDFSSEIGAAQAYTNTRGGASSSTVGIYVSTIFDCEATATHKVKFYTEAQAATEFVGSSTIGRMTASFTRLGDTP